APIEEQLMAFYNRRVERVAKQLAEGDENLRNLDKPTEMPVMIRQRDLRKLLDKMGVQMSKAREEASEDDLLPVPFMVQRLKWVMLIQGAERLVGRPPQLSTMNVMEGFMVYIKVSAITGLVLSSPWVFWQIWSFIAAGLYPQEKRYVHRYLPFSIGLFLAGVV